MQQGARGASRQLQQFRRIGLRQGLAAALPIGWGQGLGARDGRLPLQHLGDLGGAEAAKGDLLATGANRAEQALWRRRQQDQQAATRFLQGFEQGIGGPFGHGLHPLDHHQAAGRFQGPPAQELGDAAHLLQAQLGRCLAADAHRQGFRNGDQLALVLVGGLEPEQVGMVAVLEAAAQRRRSLRAGDHPLQEAPGRQGAAHPIGSAEQIGRR